MIDAILALAQSDQAASLLAEYEAARQKIDAFAQPRFEAFGPQLQCEKGCASCCVADLSVLPVEALAIAHHLVQSPQAGPVDSPAGHCSFLDAQGACTIYPVRPVVCRTQGLPIQLDAEAAQANAGGTALRIVGENITCCPLNFTEGELPQGAVLNGQILSALVFTVDQRMRATAALPSNGERVALQSLSSATVAG